MYKSSIKCYEVETKGLIPRVSQDMRDKTRSGKKDDEVEFEQCFYKFCIWPSFDALLYLP